MTGAAIEMAGVAFKKTLIEATLAAELSQHLGYASGADRPDDATNQRNDSTSKTVLTGDGPVRIETPRDRDGSFEPLLVPKHARRFTGFDDKIVALYARGLTVREIQGFLVETNSLDYAGWKDRWPRRCGRSMPGSAPKRRWKRWTHSRPGSGGGNSPRWLRPGGGRGTG
jgi:hypothetical protein